MSAEEEVLRCLIAACSPADMSNAAFLFWAYASLTVWTFILAAIYYAVLWQDLPTAIALAGGAVVAAGGYLLKALIGHQREYPACGVGHAMPSMHALIASYFSAYYCLCFWRYSRDGWLQLAYRVTGVITYGTLICVSRIQLRAGDALEVVVGAILGIASALMLLHVLMHLMQAAIPGTKQD